MALAGIGACAFDAYGTLFDLASPVARAGAALGERMAALAELWRRKQLEYTWLRSLAGQYADFWQVTGEALDYALDALGLADDGLRVRLMDAYRTPAAFADAAPALARLKSAGLRCAVLSNGAPAMLEAAVASAGFQASLDAVLSADAVRVYKPHPWVYALATAHFGLPARAVAFVSANGWDAAGAAAAGLRVIWLNRTKAPRERLPAGPELEIGALAALPDLLTG